MSKNKLRILVSGSTGQLGQELNHIATHYPSFTFDFKNRKALDLSSEKSIKKALSAPYDYFINAGAYTAVDKAENDKEAAFQINAKALDQIGKYARPSTRIIHISTDYVYNSDPRRPLLESDQTKAKGIYAQSKLEGENYLLKRRPDAIVLRTSWVYSSFGNNFLKTMLRLGQARDELSIVADQYGTPTYARDIATTIMQMIRNLNTDTYTQSPKSGLYNYANIGLTNWADFAKAIFKMKGISCHIKETTTKAYNAPAPRPLWSMMSKEKIQRDFHIKIPYWQKSLQSCLLELDK
jgi:dTDP-4-dehydrorhamnose reductase